VAEGRAPCHHGRTPSLRGEPGANYEGRGEGAKRAGDRAQATGRRPHDRQRHQPAAGARRRPDADRDASAGAAQRAATRRSARRGHASATATAPRRRGRLLPPADETRRLVPLPAASLRSAAPAFAPSYPPARVPAAQQRSQRQHQHEQPPAATSASTSSDRRQRHREHRHEHHRRRRQHLESSR
jgi:hypothetical protein